MSEGKSIKEKILSEWNKHNWIEKILIVFVIFLIIVLSYILCQTCPSWSPNAYCSVCNLI